MKAKKRSATLHFFDETWQENIYLMNGVTPEALTLFTRLQFEDDEYGNPNNFAGRCIHSDRSKGTIIALRERFTLKPRPISTLAHECFHAAEYILGSRGMFHSEATSEAYAYLTESILRRCLSLLLKKPA